MRETQAIIERVRRVADDLQHIDLTVDAALAQLEPGQSIFAAPFERTGWEPYLRAQWLPVALNPAHVVVETPLDAESRADFHPGDVVSLLSPVGQPIPVRSKIYHLLLIAEDTYPTPFIHLARKLIGGGVAVTLVTSGRASEYPAELLPPEIEIIRRETDWKWPDQVETLNWADQVLIVADEMTRDEAFDRLFEAINQIRHQSIPDGYVCGLYYPRLACAAGACLACMLPTKKQLLACADGPAIDLKRVRV